ncbi:MAG: thioredoxin [Lachnospiraceae bacterium]|nr:thioredoxin [Lachnospiraceae bacterium]
MAEININYDNFEEEVVNSDIPVLVDFWAPWCGPCSMLSPQISEIASKYEGKLKVCKVNIDDELKLAQKFNIMSIPTILLFKNKERVERHTGFITGDELMAQWEKYL